MVDLDERFEWIEVHELSGAIHYMQGPCLHLPQHVVDVDVESTGEIVARLCTTCDVQLPPASMDRDSEYAIWA